MKRTKQSTFAKRERSEKATGFAPVGGEDMTQPATHTPGPWSAYCNNEGLTITNASNVTIAYVDYDECEERPVAANASLIAAAPAMYEALQAIIKTWERGDLAAAVRQGATALAQAEGRQ